MLFNYKALEGSGKESRGGIEAVSIDVAIDSLQKRGLLVVEIEPADKKSFLSRFHLGSSVKSKDVVMLSRQMATLFDAEVSALKIFTLLSAEVENPDLKRSLGEIVDELQGGSSISKALSAHPDIFSDFYVNMVKSGEETGKLNEVFNYLADHLDRNYEVVTKAKNALIYPAFVISVFIAVMLLMFAFIIPKIGEILTESGQAVPLYTAIVLGISNIVVHYGLLLAVVVLATGYIAYRYVTTGPGKAAWADFKLRIPYVGNLYQKLYLSIITDNLSTMIASGIPMTHAIEVTAAVVGNDIYRNLLEESLVAVKGGSSFSQALSQYKEMPGVLVQMIKVGEETGELGNIMKTMARFYQREVVNAVDTLVDLIEPAMIVILGLGVGVLLASVLIPIYNIATSAGL